VVTSAAAATTQWLSDKTHLVYELYHKVPQASPIPLLAVELAVVVIQIDELGSVHDSVPAGHVVLEVVLVVVTDVNAQFPVGRAEQTGVVGTASAVTSLHKRFVLGEMLVVEPATA